jgi:hypothetical protein
VGASYARKATEPLGSLSNNFLILLGNAANLKVLYHLHVLGLAPIIIANEFIVGVHDPATQTNALWLKIQFGHDVFVSTF